MTKTKEESQIKLRKICDVLKEETLEPAKKEAVRLVEEAKVEAERIIREAEKRSQDLLAAAKKAIEQERNVFESSLVQSVKQSIERLKQSVETNFFNNELSDMLKKQMADPKVIANIIQSIITALDKEGLSTDVSVAIAKTANPEDVNLLLADTIMKKLKGKGVSLGEFGGGARVKVEGKEMTIELTNEALEELITPFIRKDLRKKVFGS